MACLKITTSLLFMHIQRQRRRWYRTALCSVVDKLHSSVKMSRGDVNALFYQHVDCRYLRVGERLKEKG